MKVVIIVCLLMYKSWGQKEKAVMQTMSGTIGDMVLECQKEMGFGKDVIIDLLDFWNEDNELMNQDLGCALVCVFDKNELVTADGKQVQANNVKAFYEAAGADDFMAQKLLKLFKLCKRATASLKNPCYAAIEVAKCFRYAVVELQWDPNPYYWNQTETPPPDFQYEQVDDAVAAGERQTEVDLKSVVHDWKEMNRRKFFISLFRRCGTK